ncbi:Hypothetical protein AA314_04857 [Archangium gephyra]|uniref:Uncharacterized protein n=1 Tax=Archangium gephyra TaxID=48 RepID=A0AAC8Q9V0_9BACT|nr:Hypothetical protein AA314_04857 [Archangium gephyra]
MHAHVGEARSEECLQVPPECLWQWPSRDCRLSGWNPSSWRRCFETPPCFSRIHLESPRRRRDGNACHWGGIVSPGTAAKKHVPWRVTHPTWVVC